MRKPKSKKKSVHVSPNHINACVHTSPDHNDDSRQVSPIFNQTPQPSQVITHPNDDIDDYDEPPRTPVSLQPPWDELNSVVYDKSDHSNSPEINHILYHGVRIYDPINPDPPIFDSSIPRSLLLPATTLCQASLFMRLPSMLSQLQLPLSLHPLFLLR
ncbi:hypothetical protein YC2023_017697 [Brassica napus]